MRILGVLIAILPILTFYKVYNKKELFSPANTFSLFYLVLILIPVIFYGDETIVQKIDNSYLINIVLDDNIYFEYIVLQTICYYLVLLGMGLRLKDGMIYYTSPKVYSRIDSQKLNINSNTFFNYRVWGGVFTFIGFVIFVILISSIGGLYYFITHLQYRTTIARSMDFFLWFLPLFRYGPLLLLYSRKESDKNISLLFVVLIIITGILSGMGGRKSLILLLFETVLIYHYAIKLISLKSIISFRNIMLIILVFLFFITFTKFRVVSVAESFFDSPLEFLGERLQDGLILFARHSYVPFYMTILKYFDSHAFWQGSSFSGLLTAVIPSSLYEDKPPVDDGMYLYSICQGREDIMPVMPFRLLNGSSYPLETFGSMYANFGLIGLLIGMILLGIIYNFFYKKMVKSKYSLFYIILYAHVIFGFHFSTLRIFQLFQTVAITWLVIKCAEKVRIVKAY